MHKSLAEALLLCKSVVSVRHFCEIGIHTRIPASVTNYAVTRVKILNIIALAGGAHKRTGAASETSG